jgi:Domain of unknown function (DUF3844)
VHSELLSSESLWRLDDVDELSEFFDSADGPAFAALEVSKLQDIRRKHGSSSTEYRAFASKLRLFLEDAIQHRPNFNIAVLTFKGPSLEARSPQQSPLPPSPMPQEPIGGISTCFTTEESCKDNTTSCSGRGQCVKASKSGRTCYVCACGVTTTGKGNKVKTDKWAGESCQKKDVSG